VSLYQRSLKTKKVCQWWIDRNDSFVYNNTCCFIDNVKNYNFIEIKQLPKFLNIFDD
jgi:hypothetical protein